MPVRPVPALTSPYHPSTNAPIRLPAMIPSYMPNIYNFHYLPGGDDVDLTGEDGKTKMPITDTFTNRHHML